MKLEQLLEGVPFTLAQPSLRAIREIHTLFNIFYIVAYFCIGCKRTGPKEAALATSTKKLVNFGKNET